jgi:hypothetical protein
VRRSCTEDPPRDPDAVAALDAAVRFLGRHYPRDALAAAVELLRASKEPGRRQTPDDQALAEIDAQVAAGRGRTAVGLVALRHSGGDPLVAEQNARRYRRKRLQMKRSK